MRKIFTGISLIVLNYGIINDVCARAGGGDNYNSGHSSGSGGAEHR